MGPVKQNSHGRGAGTKAPGHVTVYVLGGKPVRQGRVINPFPGQGRRSFVAERRTQVRVAEEQEKVLEILDTAANQIGEYCIHLGRRDRACRHQVLVPFLMAGTGDQRGTTPVAQPDNGVE